jgi:hypothetical protein
MAAKFPLLRLRRRNGRLEELMVGPDAGKMVVAIMALVLAGIALAFGHSAPVDLTALLRAIARL